MGQLTIQFFDRTNRVVAMAEVTMAEGLFRGVIDLTEMPASMRQVFEEYEEIVANQSFGQLDETEDKVRDLALGVSFGEPTAFAVEDLQMYPHASRVSFRLGQSDFNAAAAYVLKKNHALYERLA